MNRLMGNADLGREVLEKFHFHASKLMGKLQEDCKGSDAQQGAEVAHALKGAAMNINAAILVKALIEMETACRKQDVQALPDCLRQVQHEYARFTETAKTIFPTLASPE
jgi:HPt (histidine-containing phosphotransfer) domain-containing protein